MYKVSVVIPNWNGQATLSACLDSLLAQGLAVHIIVVENGSTDDSLDILRNKYPQVEVLIQKRNQGFAGGVNIGISQAIKQGANFVGLFNNDAIADKNWAKELVSFLEQNPETGIATCTMTDIKAEYLDSTGEMYTIWGLPYPRGRGEKELEKYKNSRWVFGASGGASFYRVAMLEQIGLFDADFFAYYEDVDISFRAQLSGWTVAYIADAKVRHQIGATSSKIKGFTTYQSMKNLPWLLWKNVPSRFLINVIPRFYIAYLGFFISTARRGQVWPALKGIIVCLVYSPKKTIQRLGIQSRKKVSDSYIWGIITHDLDPNAIKLRQFRDKWLKHGGQAK